MNVKHKVLQVVDYHYVVCQVTLIWKKTGFLYKALNAPSLNLGLKEIETMNYTLKKKKKKINLAI